MEVKKALGLVLILGFAACSQEKTVDRVFEEKNKPFTDQCRGSVLENRYLVQWESGKVTVEQFTSQDQFISEFMEPNLKDISKVEYDRAFQFRSQEMNSSGTSVGGMTAASSSQAPSDWGQRIIEADKLWEMGIRGQGVRVAVIDAFIDSTHHSLVSNIDVNQNEKPGNLIDDDQNGLVDDYAGVSFVPAAAPGEKPADHGTHVSGIIAGVHDSQYSFGVAPEAKVIPVQFMDNSGAGSVGDAILAVQYAIQRKAQIINASWGGAPCVEALKSVMSEASDRGILLVVAAGNSYQNIDQKPTYPAAFHLPNQITVAASGVWDLMLAFSNSGFELVQIAAPGEMILSSIPGGVEFLSGTSMAAPMVSGAAALLWGQFPKATASEIKEAILNGVDVVPGHEFQVSTRGRLNARKALEKLSALEAKK